MNEKGFIKLHRKMLEWSWYSDTNTTRLFLHCLLKANWKDGEFEGQLIPRGSFVTSISNLSKELSSNKHFFTVQQVRTALKHLIATKELTIKTTNKFTIITINNYTYYQEGNKDTNKQVTNKQQTSNKQVTTIEEYKEIKNKRSVCVENTQSLAPTLSELRSYCYDNNMGNFDYENFYNYYEANGWLNKNGTEIKNWKAKVNYWYKKDLESGKIKIDNRRRLG